MLDFFGGCYGDFFFYFSVTVLIGGRSANEAYFEQVEILVKLLNQFFIEIHIVFRLLRSANYYLGKDIGDKFSALSIDDHCANLNNASPQKYYAPNAVKVQAKLV